VVSGKLKPWRAAAEIIDWSIPCPSIFERKKPLAEKTLRRIAHGIMKFVVNNPAPFIVPVKSWGGGGNGPRSIEDPMRTTTTSKGGEHAVVVPHVTKWREGATGHDVADPLATVTANSFIKRPGGAAPLGVVGALLTPFYGDKEGRPRASNPADEPLRTSTAENRFGVVEAVCAPFVSYAQQGGANRSAEDALHTVTASLKDHNTVVAAHLVHCGNGEREGQAPRAKDVEAPLGTVMAQRNNHAAVCAFMQKFSENGRGVDPAEPLHTVMAGAPRHAVVCAHMMQANEQRNGVKAGRPADAPVSTVTTSGSHQQIVTSNLVKLRGGDESHLGSCGVDVGEPLHTVCAGGTHMAEVRAFLIKYYGIGPDGHELEAPLGTVTAKDRFGLVTVTIEGEEYVIVDIGMRMLTPRELFNAQGFPPGYIIDRDAAGRPITKTAQVAKCGNSVCPPIAEALVRANVAIEQEGRAAA
jgi:DNA (cytosine-5)-methyltransferase 1